MALSYPASVPLLSVSFKETALSKPSKLIESKRLMNGHVVNQKGQYTTLIHPDWIKLPLRLWGVFRALQ